MLYVSDAAKAKIDDIKKGDSVTENHFIRVSVTSGGCSGLSYKMDFDNQVQPNN